LAQGFGSQQNSLLPQTTFPFPGPSHLAMCSFHARLLLVVGVSVSGVSADPQAVQVRENGNVQAEVQPHSQSLAEGQFKGASGLKSLIRSEELTQIYAREDSDGDPDYHYTGNGHDIAPAGVVEGACANFRKTAVNDVSVSCPLPLKMVGCSCRDKAGENSGGCGTKFGTMETCNAYTKDTRGITAYVRCCNVGTWANNFTIATSAASEVGDGKSVASSCPDDTDLLGCACVPVTTPGNPCKHNQVTNESTCLATNLDGRAGGVKSQALCASISDSSSWESVRTPPLPPATSTDLTSRPVSLACSTADLHMISCSCGSDIGQCNGGKVLGNKCSCNGERCDATARCADIPTPPADCHWQHWGEWSECSSDCGKGSVSRVREVAMLASCNDATPKQCGGNCSGPTEQVANCTGMLTNQECNVTIVIEHPKKTSYLMHIIGAAVGSVVILLIIIGVYMNQSSRKRGPNLDGYGDDDGGDYGASGGMDFSHSATLQGGGGEHYGGDYGGDNDGW